METSNKEGRVLSARNLSAIRSAMAGMLSAVTTISGLLKPFEPETEIEVAVEDEKGVPETPLEKKKAWLLSQEETNYNALRGTVDTACLNCRWFNRWVDDDDDGLKCQLVDCYPQPIVYTGLCDRHESVPEPAIEEMDTEPVPVVVVEPVEIMIAMEQKSPLQKAIDLVKGLFAKDDVLPAPFQVMGDYWVAWWSNNLEDLQKEIITKDAHARYLARVDAGLTPLPELWWWHIAGTKHGETLWLAQDTLEGGKSIMLAVGKFDDTPIAKAFKKYHTKNIEAVSHGFTTKDHFMRKEGDLTLYDEYNTFEISPLPTGKEANPYTLYALVKELTMLSEDKIKELTGIVGKEKADEILALNASVSKEVADVQARYKDFADVTDKKETPAPATSAMNDLVVEMIKQQGDFAVLIKSMEAKHIAAIKEISDKLDAANKELASVKAELAPPKAPASQAPETRLSKEQVDALLATAKKGVDDATIDPFFAPFQGVK